MSTEDHEPTHKEWQRAINEDPRGAIRALAAVGLTENTEKEKGR